MMNEVKTNVIAIALFCTTALVAVKVAVTFPRVPVAVRLFKF
jgi:hypothetical protein